MIAENAQSTAQGLRELGVEAIGIACDVSDQEQVKNTIDTVIAKWGTIDILVNNAQASRVKTFEDMTADNVHLAYSTGTLSTFFFMKGVLLYSWHLRTPIISPVKQSWSMAGESWSAKAS